MATAKPRRARTVLPDPVFLGVGQDVFEAHAKVLEPSVLQQAGVTVMHLDALRPGGRDNPDTTAMGWYRYVLSLTQLKGADNAVPVRSARWDGQAMEDLRASLAEEPVFVRFECDGITRGVYPKSEYAINRIMLIDIALQWLVPRVIAMRGEAAHDITANLRESLERGIEAQRALECEFVWIATHPGADVPWPEDGQWEHAAPEWTRACTTYDFIATRTAYIDVNLLRSNSVAERTHAIAGRGDGDAMSFAQFLGIMSADMNIPPSEIARRWSVNMLYAQSSMRWEAQRLAERKAKEQA